MEKFSLADVANLQDPQVLWEQAGPFMNLMLQYESALLEMETKLKTRLPTKYYENSGVLNLSRPQPIL